MPLLPEEEQLKFSPELNRRKTSAKLRGTKLQAYWRKICENERRSKQRNTSLLNDLDRINSNLINLSARTEHLRMLKIEYETTIAKMYPQWLEQMKQSRQKQQEQQQLQQQQHQYQIQQMYQQQQQHQMPQHQHQELEQQHQQQQLKKTTKHTAESVQKIADQAKSSVRVSSGTTSVSSSPSLGAGRKTSNGEYVNINETVRSTTMRSESPGTVGARSEQRVSSAIKQAAGDDADRGQMSEGMVEPPQGWAERDGSVNSISYSEEIDIPGVQSVTVRARQTDSNAMTPKSDEEESDFDEVELPENGRRSPTPGQNHRGSMEGEGDGLSCPSSPAPSPPTSPQPPLIHTDQETLEGTGQIQAELSTEGLLLLLKYVERDLEDPLSLEGFYRTHHPTAPQRAEIIRKANRDEINDLRLDAELVSMVILDQLTLVIRSLPDTCILPDSLLLTNIHNIAEARIRSRLHRNSQYVWEKLLEHFICLVMRQVMDTKEVAFIFTPCLVQESSQYQDRACSLLAKIVEEQCVSATDRFSPSGQDSLDTARSSSQLGPAGVPLLKFGSLIDRPFSDEESSMISQSLPTEGPRVPLNETEAYKSLVSGSLGMGRQSQMRVREEEDDTDDDVEKQFASALSPRLPMSTKSGAGSAIGSIGKSIKRTGFPIDSDLDTDTEINIESPLGRKGSSADDDDFHDFYN
ncbi:hypothetical protein CHS0354_014585 [Potamilus streckersoni]|uniref:Centrosomal protein kizuna n=1 Tax=Potamilus streckersoni TaxID=2493646 RepID=A0AAE0RNS6_9BIVA|nr:hypothetical protein CHS0354_014585 [Potamilus streckersoni]